MSINTANALLQAISSFRQFVVYRADKVPLRAADLEAASVTNPADWCNYDEAIKRVGNDDICGVGFVLIPENNLTVIDLDSYKTTDVAILANHTEIFNSFDTYTETSPSGRGGHVWCKGWVPSRKFSQQHLEVYSSGRYITITGNAVCNVEIKEKQQLLDELIASIDAATGRRKSNAPTLWTEQPEQFIDDEIIQKASTDNRGQRFQDLFAGRWSTIIENGSPKYPSQSEADLALCNHIAIYTNNMQQCGRIFRKSVLAQRDKAKRDGYLFNPHWGIISIAFDQKLSTETYEALKKHYESRQFDNVASTDRVVEPASVFSRPTGLLGDIAEYIYQSSVLPNIEVALAGAITFMAGVCGRQFNTSTGTGLNLYIVLVGDTSHGKEGAARGISRLFKAVQPMAPGISQFAGPSDIASAQALLKYFADSNCFWSHKGEFGHWLQRLNSKFASPNDTVLKGMLLDLFHKSGADDLLMGSIYSDKKNNAPNVIAPSLTLFGDSTPEEFYKAVDESNIAEGLISRLTIIPIPKAKPFYNATAKQQRDLPESLKWRLAGLVKRVCELQMTNAFIEVPETPDASTFQLAYQKECLDKSWNDGKSDPTAKIWQRAHIRLLRLGSLLAVGNNPDNPCVQVDDYKWSRIFIDHSNNAVVKRFESGEVGQGNLHNEQLKDLKHFLTTYRDCRWSNEIANRYKVTFDMFKARAIPFRTILNKCSGLASFRKSPNSSLAIQSVLREFEHAGYLVKCDMAKVHEWKLKSDVWCVGIELE